MSKAVRKAYKSAGLKPPNGKGVHTLRGHQCVIRYLKKGLSKDEAWKRCIGGLGKHAIKPGHRRTV